jgi:hypothetical protein
LTDRGGRCLWQKGATPSEIVNWLKPHREVPHLRLGDLAGRISMSSTSMLPADLRGLTPRARDLVSNNRLSSSVERAVAYREEIVRHVRQQVELATPFDCICAQGEGIDLEGNLSSVIDHFAARVPRERTIFISAHRVDLIGLAPFQAVWGEVHALALYDWNGGGLQGRQFSSTINRLICREAETVHSWVERVVQTKECW